MLFLAAGDASQAKGRIEQMIGLLVDLVAQSMQAVSVGQRGSIAGDLGNSGGACDGLGGARHGVVELGGTGKGAATLGCARRCGRTTGARTRPCGGWVA